MDTHKYSSTIGKDYLMLQSKGFALAQMFVNVHLIFNL